MNALDVVHHFSPFWRDQGREDQAYIEAESVRSHLSAAHRWFDRNGDTASELLKVHWGLHGHQALEEETSGT